MGLEQKLGNMGIVTVRLEDAVNWARSNAIWPMLFGLACCAIEMMAAGASHYDFDRFGVVFRASPRQADVIIIAGTVTKKMAPVVRRVYDQMAEPKWVIAFGVCASTGGFYQNYSTMPGADQVIPVDVYIPGCPPRPEMVIDGLVKLQDKVQAETLADHVKGPAPVTPPERLVNI